MNRPSGAVLGTRAMWSGYAAWPASLACLCSGNGLGRGPPIDLDLDGGRGLFPPNFTSKMSAALLRSTMRSGCVARTSWRRMTGVTNRLRRPPVGRGYSDPVVRYVRFALSRSAVHPHDQRVGYVGGVPIEARLSLNRPSGAFPGTRAMWSGCAAWPASLACLCSGNGLGRGPSRSDLDLRRLGEVCSRRISRRR